MRRHVSDRSATGPLDRVLHEPLGQAVSPSDLKPGDQPSRARYLRCLRQHGIILADRLRRLCVALQHCHDHCYTDTEYVRAGLHEERGRRWH